MSIMNKEVYDLSHKLAAKWCYRNQLDIIGAKKSNNYLYVRGFNGGFPHEAATIKIDIDSGEIIQLWGFYGCPVTILEREYE